MTADDGKWLWNNIVLPALLAHAIKRELKHNLGTKHYSFTTRHTYEEMFRHVYEAEKLK